MPRVQAKNVRVDNNEYDNHGNWDVKMTCLFTNDGSRARIVEVTIKGEDSDGNRDQITKSRYIETASDPTAGEEKEIEPLVIAWKPTHLHGPSQMVTTALLLTKKGTLVPGSESAPIERTVTF